MDLENGISVIVPSYKGENHIHNLLDSLKEQSLSYDLFEVIFIINGELDNTPNILNDFKKENPQMNVVIDYSDVGASNARNKGIDLATRHYTTFIDDDDFISPNYLKKFLEHAKPNRIVINYLLDVDINTGEFKESYITKVLPEEEGIAKNPYTDMSAALNPSCGKLIPTKAIKNTFFNPDLKTTEDAVFIASLCAKNDFEFYTIGKDEDSTYCRILRPNSLSRQKISYEFSIIDRLKVINVLLKMFPTVKNNDLNKHILNLINAAAYNFMNSYLKQYPNQLERVLDEINKYNFEFFPFKTLIADVPDISQPKELVVSYVFPPVVDTSGNVVAKKILLNNEYVDVLTGTHYTGGIDESLSRVVNEYVFEKMEVEVSNTYSHSEEYREALKFVKEGLKLLNTKPTYKKIYTRVKLMPPHLLGFFYRATHDTFWQAEFSDPVIMHPRGVLASSPVEDKQLVDAINKFLPEGFDKVKTTDTFNKVIEYITFALADEILFTNENQRQVMVEDFPKIKDIVLNKSKVIKPRVLGDFYYNINDFEYELDDSYVNFAYFGSLYGFRSFEDFVAAFSNLNKEFKDKFRLHIFTSDDSLFRRVLTHELLLKTTFNPSLEYFDFLNITKKMDVLLVEDAITDNMYDVNPFLPSKFIDYLGSGSDIWAICENGSIMDGMSEIKYKSHLNDLNSSIKVANQIMADKLGLKIELTDLDDDEIIKYYQKNQIHIINNMMNLADLLDESIVKSHNLNKENMVCKTQLQEYKEYVAYLRKWMRPHFLVKGVKKLRNAFRKFKSYISKKR